MAYEFDFEKTKNQLANQALRQSSPIGAGDTTQSVKPDSTSIIDSLGASVKGLFKNPLIAQWLIGMGSGMAGAPTMGIGLGNGLKAAGVAASNEMTRQATAEDEMNKEQTRLQAVHAEHAYDRQSRMDTAEYTAALKAQQKQADREATAGTMSAMYEKVKPALANKTPEQRAYIEAAIDSGVPTNALTAIGEVLGPKAQSEAAKAYGTGTLVHKDGFTYLVQKNLNNPDEEKIIGTPVRDQVTGGDQEIITESDGSQTVGYRDSNNIFRKISSTTAPQNLSEGTQKAVEDLAASMNQSQRLTETYRPEFSGSSMFDRAKGVMDGKLKWSEISGNDQGGVLWWKDYQGWVNDVRNAKFGASLTTPEKTEFEKYVIGRDTDPKLVSQYLTYQQNIARKAAERRNKMIQGGNYQQGQKDAAKEQLAPKPSSKFMDGQVAKGKDGNNYKRINGRWNIVK